MTNIYASAPGKAVLSGEYVVLDGAPALAVAVNRRATVSISSTKQRFHQVTAPGLSGETWQFEDDTEGSLRWQDETAAELFSLFAGVWRQVRPLTNDSLDIRIDSSEFQNGRNATKLGLGSSAAVAVSLTAGLQQLSASSASDPASIMRLAGTAHLEFQGGYGSGVDIATSATGGVIRYEMDSAPIAFDAQWPDGLLCRFLWSGQSADTADHVEKYEQRKLVSAGTENNVALTESAAQIALHWPNAAAPQLLSIFANYTALLRQFSDENHLGIFAAGHDELSALATSCGIVYKPCGAGGGDIGVAMALGEQALNDFCEQAQCHGFTALDVTPDWQGVAVDIESSE